MLGVFEALISPAMECYAVTEINVFQLSQPGTLADPLTEVLRNGARALLAQAVEAEVSSLLSCHADKLTDDGRRRLVRHGHLPDREIMTSIGPVAVRCPRVRDRGGEGCERILVAEIPRQGNDVDPRICRTDGQDFLKSPIGRSIVGEDQFKFEIPPQRRERRLQTLEEQWYTV